MCACRIADISAILLMHTPKLGNWPRVVSLTFGFWNMVSLFGMLSLITYHKYLKHSNVWKYFHGCFLNEISEHWDFEFSTYQHKWVDDLSHCTFRIWLIKLLSLLRGHILLKEVWISTIYNWDWEISSFSIPTIFSFWFLVPLDLDIKVVPCQLCGLWSVGKILPRQSNLFLVDILLRNWKSLKVQTLQ